MTCRTIFIRTCRVAKDCLSCPAGRFARGLKDKGYAQSLTSTGHSTVGNQITCIHVVISDPGAQNELEQNRGIIKSQ